MASKPVPTRAMILQFSSDRISSASTFWMVTISASALRAISRGFRSIEVSRLDDRRIDSAQGVDFKIGNDIGLMSDCNIHHASLDLSTEQVEVSVGPS